MTKLCNIGHCDKPELQAEVEKYRSALEEIAQLTAPGGFPRYPLLFEIAIKGLKREEYDPTSLKAARGKIETLYASLTEFNEQVRQLQSEVDRLKEGVRDHIGWADDAVDCDDLRILIGDMEEPTENNDDR